MVDDRGSVYADRSDIDFAAIRGEQAINVATWQQLVEWVDELAERMSSCRALGRDGPALWSFVRMRLVERLVAELPTLVAIVTALQRSGASHLELVGGDASLAEVAKAAASLAGVPLHLHNVHGDTMEVGSRAARGMVHAARAVLGVVRSARGRRGGGTAGVLALGYSTWRRVRTAGGWRHLDPAFSPIVAELRRRAVPVAHYSMPTANRWQVEAEWVLHGESTAVPVELAWGLWWVGSGGRQARRATDACVEELRECAAHLRTCYLTFGGREVGTIAGAVAIELMRQRIPRAVRQTHFFETLLRDHRPGVLLLTSEYSGAALAATLAARRQGIPVVAVQHGVIWPGHPGYVAGPSAHRWIIRPDVVCVYGRYERGILLECGGFDARAVVATGAPRFDLLGTRRDRSASRREVVTALGLPAEIPLVLFSSSGPESAAVARRLGGMLDASPRPISVIVKLHPIAESHPEAFAQLATGSRSRLVRVIREEFDLYDLLAAADVHASTNSTVLSEACAFDLPNLLLCGERFADTVDYAGRHVAVHAEPFGSLAAAVDAVVRGPEAVLLREGRTAFVAEHFFALDGLAAARIADVVQAQMRQGG